MSEGTPLQERVGEPPEQKLRLVGVQALSGADRSLLEKLMSGGAQIVPAIAAAAPALLAPIWEDNKGARFILKPTDSGIEVIPFGSIADPKELHQSEHPLAESTRPRKIDSPELSDGGFGMIEEAIRRKIENAPEELLKMAEKWAVKEAASQLKSLYSDIVNAQAPTTSPQPSSQVGLPSIGDVYDDPAKAFEKFQEWRRNGGLEALTAESGIDLGIDQAYGLFEDAMGLGELTDRSSTPQFVSKAALDSLVKPYLKDLLKAQMVSLLKEQFPETFRALDAESSEDPMKKLLDRLGAKIDPGPRFLAARRGDPTSHAGTLATGAGRTVINDLPAVRATDLHICSGHPPNAVRQGNPTIVIEGMLASRLDHETLCNAKVQPAGSNVFYGVATADVLPTSPAAKSAPTPSGAGSASGAGGTAAGGSAAGEGEGALEEELAALEARKVELRRRLESGGLTPEQDNQARDEHTRIENRISQINATLGIDEETGTRSGSSDSPASTKTEQPQAGPRPVPPVVVDSPSPASAPRPAPPTPTPPLTSLPETGGGATQDGDCEACDCKPPCRMEGTWEVLPHPADLDVSDLKNTQVIFVTVPVPGLVHVFEFNISGTLKAVLLCRCSCGRHECRKRISVPFKVRCGMRTPPVSVKVPMEWLKILRAVRGGLKLDNLIQEFAPELQIAIREITNSADRVCQGLSAIERILNQVRVSDDWTVWEEGTV